MSMMDLQLALSLMEIYKLALKVLMDIVLAKLLMES